MPKPAAFLCILAVSVLIACCGSLHAKEPVELIRDDYSSATHPVRQPMRGDWKFVEGMATVKQDEQLYKKYNNHGPIMVYPVEHSNASVVVEFKPQGYKTVVFTLDAADGGHAFRVIMRSEALPQPSTIQTYTEKQENGKAKPIVLNREVPKLKDGVWHRIKVVVRDEKAVVEIGDKIFTVAHERISQKKNMAKLGFSFGELSIRKFEMSSI